MATSWRHAIGRARMWVACLCYCTTLVSGNEYRLVIDAGSTGSRLKMFMWQGDKLVEISPSSEDDDLFHVNPGVSSYVDSPELAGVSVDSMLNASKKYIPRDSWASTKLWFMATAGVRFLPAADRDALMIEVERHLSQPGRMPYSFQHVHIMSGVQEAVFGFLSINHWLDFPEPEVGILDLGGKSTQIAFKPAKGGVLNFDSSLYVHGKFTSIYATSYSRFGTETTLSRALDEVVRANPGHTKIDFPCFLTGTSVTAKISNGSEVYVTGTGDVESCSGLTASLLHTDYECSLPPCSMMARYIATVEGIKFYALNAYFYTMLNLGLLDWGEQKVLKPAEILNATKALCVMSKEEAEAASSQPWEYLHMGCLEGFHVYHMLRAYGFSDDTTDIIFAFSVNGNSADWTSGLLLFEEYNPHGEPFRGGGCDDDELAVRTWIVRAGALGVAWLLTCCALGLLLSMYRLRQTRPGGSDQGFSGLCTEDPALAANGRSA